MRCIQLWRVIPFLLLNVSPLFAQGSVDNALSVSLGGAGSAYFGAIPGMELNPARLAAFEYHPRRFSFSIFPLGLALQNNAFSIESYNRFLGRQSRNVPEMRSTTFWTAQDKEAILALVPQMWRLNVGVNVQLLGVAVNFSEEVGALGLSVRDYLGTRLAIHKPYLDLALNGNSNLLGQRIESQGSNLRSWWYREYALTYAREIPLPSAIGFRNFYAGASLKYIQSFAFAHLDNQTTIFTSQTGDSLASRLSYQWTAAVPERVPPFLTPDVLGSGFAVDVGISAEIYRGLTAAIALTNLGSLSFAGSQVQQRVADTTVSFTGLTDPFDDKTTQRELDSLRKAIEHIRPTQAPFGFALPTAIRLGTAFDLRAYTDMPITLTLDLVQGINTNFGNTTTPLLAIGAEWRALPTLPIRAGVRLGGDELPAVALGLSFDTPEATFDLATRDLYSLFSSSSARQFSVSVGIRFRLFKPTESLPPEQQIAPVIAYQPLPIVEIVAGRNRIEQGDSTLLVWTTVDADSVFIEPEIGKVSAKGARTLHPSVSTTYTIRAKNRYGEMIGAAHVRVEPKPQLPPPPPPVPLAKVGDKLAVRINFPLNKFQIPKTELYKLDTLVALLKTKEREKFIVEISGHTDNTGKGKVKPKGPKETIEQFEKRRLRFEKARKQYNLTLSLKRAQSVQNYLVKSGIDARRLTVRGAGEEEPVASNDTEEGRAQNRRMEAKIIGELFEPSAPVKEAPNKKAARKKATAQLNGK